MERNNEIYFGCEKHYINTLFAELKRKEQRLLNAKCYWVDDNLNLVINDTTELQKDVEDFRKYVWEEYERLYRERNKI